MSTTNEEILHYQRKMVKYSSDTKVLLHCLSKLAKLPIGVQHLQDTGIGRTINGMRKSEGSVGEEARSLVNKWKEMVAAEDKSDSENEQEEEKNMYSDEDDKGQSSSKHKELKPKESPKEDKIKGSTSSKTKSGSSRHKSPEKPCKSSKSGDKQKEPKESGASKSSSKSSRKRHHEDAFSQLSSKEDDPEGGQSFAAVLGSIDTGSKKKKSKDKDKEKDKDKDKDKEKHREERKQKATQLIPTAPSLPPPLPVPPKPVSMLDIKPIDYEISPHYKPLPLRFVSDSPVQGKGKVVSAEEALSVAMSQKGSRTKVFSGNRSSGLSFMPSLFDFCIRVLQQNIDALEYTGGVPYDLLRPVLERASAQQLYSLEHFNPYLLDDTDELWKLLCQKEYRKAVREEMESYRDLYLRCHEEREARLKSLTINHKSAMAKATPVRTTKLAYVESIAKNPRGSSKIQLKNGSSAVLESMTKPKTGVRPFEASNNGGASGGSLVAEVVRMNPPPASRSSSSSSSCASANKKPKAPLMQKTLKFIKNRYRR